MTRSKKKPRENPNRFRTSSRRRFARIAGTAMRFDRVQKRGLAGAVLGVGGLNSQHLYRPGLARSVTVGDPSMYALVFITSPACRFGHIRYRTHTELPRRVGDQRTSMQSTFRAYTTIAGFPDVYNRCRLVPFFLQSSVCLGMGNVAKVHRGHYSPSKSMLTVRWGLHAQPTNQMPPFRRLTAHRYGRVRDHVAKNKRTIGLRSGQLSPHRHPKGERSTAWASLRDFAVGRLGLSRSFLTSFLFLRRSVWSRATSHHLGR